MDAIDSRPASTDRALPRSSAASRARAVLRGPPLPREHGAWFMLVVPLAVGLASPHGPPIPAGAAVIAAALALFLAQDAARRLWRGQRTAALVPWLAIWTTLATTAGAALLWWQPRPALVLVAAAGVALFAIELGIERTRRRSLRLLSDVLAAAGLALAAPAAMLLGGGTGWAPALVWAACVAYFGSGVVHVRLLLACARLRRSPPAAVARAARPSLAYHAVLGAMALSMPFVLGAAPGLAWTAAFAPVVIRGLADAIGAHAHASSLKRVGVLESAYSVVFAVLAVAALRVG